MTQVLRLLGCESLVEPNGNWPVMSCMLWTAIAHCRKLLVHFMRRDDSRADCTAGNNSATSTPMIAITTNNSTSVKPARQAARRGRETMAASKMNPKAQRTPLEGNRSGNVAGMQTFLPGGARRMVAGPALEQCKLKNGKWRSKMKLPPPAVIGQF